MTTSYFFIHSTNMSCLSDPPADPVHERGTAVQSSTFIHSSGGAFGLSYLSTFCSSFHVDNLSCHISVCLVIQTSTRENVCAARHPHGGILVQPFMWRHTRIVACPLAHPSISIHAHSLFHPLNPSFHSPFTHYPSHHNLSLTLSPFIHYLTHPSHP